MKNWLKILGIIGLVAVIGFGVIACGDGGTSSPPPKPKTPVTGVSLDEHDIELTLTVVDDLTLTATVEPSDATNKNVTWESSDKAVADVISTGISTSKVIAVGEGTATITVKTVDGGFEDTCNVIVNGEPPIDTILYDVEVDGASNTITSTEIKFIFGAPVTDLAVGDITITAGSGSATIDSLVSGSGTEWIFAITVTAQGSVSVKIDKAPIFAQAMPFTVYKYVNLSQLPDSFWEYAGNNDGSVICTIHELSDYVVFGNGTITLTQNPGDGNAYRVQFDFSPALNVTTAKGVLFDEPDNGNWNITYTTEDNEYHVWGAAAGNWGLWGDINEDPTITGPNKNLISIELWSGNATGTVEITYFNFEN